MKFVLKDLDERIRSIFKEALGEAFQGNVLTPVMRHQLVRDWLAGKCRECHTAYLTDEHGCGDKEVGLSWSYVCSESGCPYTFLKEILRGDYDKDVE